VKASTKQYQIKWGNKSGPSAYLSAPFEMSTILQMPRRRRISDPGRQYQRNTGYLTKERRSCYLFQDIVDILWMPSWAGMDCRALEDVEPSFKVRRSTARNPGKVREGTVERWQRRTISAWCLDTPTMSCDFFACPPTSFNCHSALFFVAITVTVGRDCPHG
jgi:hypothetical protein